MPEVKQFKVTEPWLHTSCGLGEAPFWEKDTNTLRFVDIVNEQLHTVDLNKSGPPSQAHQVHQLELSISTTADIEGNDDEFVFGGKAGYGVMNKKTHKWRYIKKYWDEQHEKSDLQSKEHRMRGNDGSVDKAGRYFVGTMSDPKVGEIKPEGVFFRLDPDLSLHRIISPVTIPNGTSWTLDDKHIYLTDSPTGEIRKYPYDISTGAIDLSNPQPFFKCPYPDAVPDGHAQDAEGHFWISLFGAGKVVRVNPEGQIVAEIELPTRCPTCPGICGEDLYITSAEEEEPEKFPWSVKYQGAVFKVPIGVKGAPLNKFRMEKQET